MRERTTIALLMLAFFALPVHAQSSAGFKLEEHAFNSGGTPAAGAAPSSASLRLGLSSLGEAPAARDLSSASFRADGGFTTAYPPRREVRGLSFSAKDTLTWNAEASAGVYNLYRDLHSNLAGLGFGQCEQQGLIGTAATDSDAVPAGDGFFYLVAVENRLGEEGSKGSQSGGAERGGNVCP